MNIKSQILAVSLICFFGDGHPLSDRCFDVPFSVDYVQECRTVGLHTPPTVNTGVSNPGMGMVRLSSVNFQIPEVAATAFVSRGYSSFRPTDAMVYILDADLISVDGMEECSVFGGHD